MKQDIVEFEEMYENVSHKVVKMDCQTIFQIIQ